MNKEENNFLKKVINHKGGGMFERGVISPASLFNGLGEHKNDKLIHKLISFGYIEEVPDDVNGKIVNFYRISEKGYNEFGPWYKKAWQFFTEDMAKILSIISLILSIIATIASFYKNNI
jgi:hypothetical protein